MPTAAIKRTLALAAVSLLLSLPAMPRQFKEQITGAAIPTPRPSQEALRPVASPTNTFVAPGQDELSVLADSLRQLAPAVDRAGAQHVATQRDQAAKQGLAAAETIANPKSQGAWSPPTDPEIPVAYRDSYGEAYMKGIARRNGQAVADDFLKEYAAASQKPDFQFDAFSSDFRQRALQGMENPELSIAAGAHLDNAISQARGDYRHVVQKKLIEERAANFSSALANVGKLPGPDVNASIINAARDEYIAQGGTAAEAASLVLQHLVGKSTQAGGDPDLIDLIATTKDPRTGKTILEHNPGLADAFASAKRNAQTMFEHTMADLTLGARQDALTQIHQDLASGSLNDHTPEHAYAYFKQYAGKGNVLDKEGDLAHYMDIWQKNRDAAASLKRSVDLMAAGAGHAVPEKDAKAILDRTLWNTPMLFMAPDSPDWKGAMEATVNGIARTGVDFPYAPLKSYVNALKNEVPSKDAKQVSDRFLRAAALYQSLKAHSNKALVGQYFDAELADSMETYLSITNDNQVPAVDAWKAAMATFDPEQKARWHEMVKDPEFQKKVLSKADDGVRLGLARLTRRVPFVDGPDNSSASIVGMAATAAAKRYAMMNPNATSDDVASYVKSWSEQNVYYDSNTNANIVMPRGQNTPSNQAALSWWLQQVEKAQSLGGVKMTPRVAISEDGTVNLALQPEGGVQSAWTAVPLATIRDAHLALSDLKGPALETLAGITDKLRSGKATAADLSAAEGAINIAKSRNSWPADLERMAAKVRETHLSDAFKTKFNPVSAQSALGITGGYDVARKIEAPAARNAVTFLKGGNPTAALVAASEALRTTSYADSGGRSIGYGYNMTRNGDEQTIKDFRAAGIPVDQLEAIKAGTVQITEEQANRLLLTTLDRYAANARDVVEKREPGAWNKITPQQRAVLTDLAYQGGKGNLSKLGDAVDKLVKGDLSGAGLVLHIAGKPDSRRHDLRKLMLAGPVHFNSILSHAAKQAANPVELRVAGGR